MIRSLMCTVGYMLGNSQHAAVVTATVVFATRPAWVILFLVVYVRMFVSLSVSAITPKPLEISSRNVHHPMVARADNFENGYIGVRGW